MAKGAAWARGVARQRASNVERISAPDREVIQAIVSPRRRRPRGEVHAPERPGSLQYHAPSSAFTSHQRGEGTGVLVRLFMRAELHPQ